MLILLKIKVNKTVLRMDIINSYSVSAHYKKWPVISCAESIQQRHQLLESIFHYEKTEFERYVVQRLLCILDQQSDEKYRQLIDKLHKFEIEDRTINKESRTSAVHRKPLSDLHASIAVVATTSAVGSSDSLPTDDPFYNATKQQWAHNLLEKVKKVVDKIVGATAKLAGKPTLLPRDGGVRSSIEKVEKEPEPPSQEELDKAALLKIQTEVDRLAALGTNLTNADFESLYSLPKKIFDTVQTSSLFTGGQKTDFINDLSVQYGNADQLAQVFADGRIEGLKDILNVVKGKLTEEEYSIFLELQQELENLQTSVHTYDQDKFDRIDQVGDQLADTINVSALSRNDKINLCSQISYLYKDQVAAVDSFDVVVDATIFVNSHQEAIFDQISSLITSLMGVFALINLGQVTTEISSAAMAGALQTVRAINSRFDDLTAEQQQLVNNALNTLSTFKAPDYIGAIWAYFVASTVLAMNTSASMQDVGAVIKEAAKELEGSKLSIADSIKTTMENIVSATGQFKPGNTVNGGEETYTIYSQQNGSVKINPQLLNRGNIGFLPNITNAANRYAETTARAYFTFKALAGVQIAQLQSKIDESRGQLKDYQALKAELYKDQLYAQSNELQAMALPSAVASVLIDRYMPKEVGFLNGIYDQLYYSNLGSSVGNAMIDAISEYVNAATYFNFASYVGQQPAVGEKGKDVFPGTADSARNKLETERKKAAAYLKSTQDAEIVLDEQVKRVTEDSKISNEQRTRIIDSLNNYRDNLNAISGSLVLLQNYLAPLSVSEGSVAGTFRVTGGEEQWQARLEILEDALVSGLSGNAISGGMFPLQATIQSDQQSYADMGQNYQLELQMHLTSMQQEWTVVATSLQVLNQMYLSLARSLMG
ncbi:effector from type III secretion system family protein [Chlamydia psittaci]|uniref:Effector from type III secretion system family protein n=3 Tax=Chlamydia/Chlamydophila group TaxID=1113537 RepID=A0ABX5VXA7_9CHLA|nr:effector from type III secretion system family protein [Chlamydia psittaci 08-2626_L3]QDE37225.1 effector from type III secretion system family protein [Chlamydophila parapsittaci]QHE18884.1 effector from type III secretion system family protein [Chlamydia psittaci]